jgi:hypothetical protein
MIGQKITDRRQLTTFQMGKKWESNEKDMATIAMIVRDCPVFFRLDKTLYLSCFRITSNQKSYD